jgi:hypothetical protein
MGWLGLELKRLGNIFGFRTLAAVILKGTAKLDVVDIFGLELNQSLRIDTTNRS